MDSLKQKGKNQIKNVAYYLDTAKLEKGLIDINSTTVEYIRLKECEVAMKPKDVFESTTKAAEAALKILESQNSNSSEEIKRFKQLVAITIK